MSIKSSFLFSFFIPLFLGDIQKTCYTEDKIKIQSFKNFVKSKIKSNSVLITEFEKYHLECLPGFTKYFLDLGYNVDILLDSTLGESMKKFKPFSKLRIFEFKKKKQIKKKFKLLSKKLKKYKYLFLETLEKKFIPFYKKLGFYDNPNSLFVIHHIDEIHHLGIKTFISKNQVFGLTDYGLIPYLNPNYFGNFKLTYEKGKNSFFITSTKLRNYKHFIDGVFFLKNNSIDFEINVVGRFRNFRKVHVPKELRRYFHFYGNVRYQKLYEIVNKSDFIILNLYPDRKNDNLFRTFRATGNAQLAYGFYKPVLIEENFAKAYKFSNNTAIIYKGHNISSAMLEAVKMTKNEYLNMSVNVKYLQEKIYNISLNNLKNVLKNK